MDEIDPILIDGDEQYFGIIGFGRLLDFEKCRSESWPPVKEKDEQCAICKSQSKIRKY